MSEEHKKEHHEGHEHHRKARKILLYTIRILLFLVLVFAIYEGRRAVAFTAFLVFVLSFASSIFKAAFKRESVAIFDITIIVFIFGLLSFWEIKGVYSNSWLLAFIMNFAEGIAIGLLGLTIVYTFFRTTKIEAESWVIALFSFCFAFTIGTLFEIGEVFLDYALKFSLHSSGLYGTTGDLVTYFFGSLLVSFAGHVSLKRGNPLLISKFLENVAEKNPKIFGIKKQVHESEESIKELISKGENEKFELKSSLRKNLHTNAFDRQIEHSVLKTINAYLNSDGGTLLIGVSDKGEVLGLNADEFTNEDHAQRHLNRLIYEHLGAELASHVRLGMIKLDGKSIIKVDCSKSQKESFLKQGKDEHFYIRQGSMSIPLHGSSLLKYIEGNFRDMKN